WSVASPPARLFSIPAVGSRCAVRVPVSAARTSAVAQPGSTVMRIPDIVRMGVLGVLYVVTAQMGLTLDAVNGFAAAVWPPTGLALVALVLYGPHLWPSVALSAFFVNWWAGAPVLVAGGMALGNTLEALLGSVLLTRVVRFRPALARLRDVLGLLVLASGLSPLGR